MKRLFKRLVSVSLATVMCLMAIPVTKNAAVFAVPSSSRTKLNVENVTIGPGDAGKEVQIPVKIENLSAAGETPELKSCSLELEYDESLSFGNKKDEKMFVKKASDSSEHILSIEADIDPPEENSENSSEEIKSNPLINEDGVLFTLSFTLPESLGDKIDYSITINYCELLNSEGDEISSEPSSGHIEYNENRTTKETFYQENPVEIAIESAEIPAMAGEEISVPVTIADNAGIAGSMFSFEYDSRLKYLDTSWDIIRGTDVTSETSSTEGMGVITITSANASDSTEDGTLFTFNFEVPEDVEIGDVYHINIVKCSLTNSGFHNLKFVTKNAKLTARNNNILPDPTDPVVETIEPETTNNIVTKPVSKKNDPDSLSVATVVEYDNAGEKKVDVPVYIENNSGFASNTVVFKYDTRLFIRESDIKLSSDLQGSLLPFIDANEGTITLSSVFNSNVKQDGNVFWLTFTLPDNVKEGDFYPIKIDTVPEWNHINEKGEDGYIRGSVTYKSLTVTTDDGGISVEKKPVVTTTKPVVANLETTVTTAKKAGEERHTVPIQPLTVNSKNVISITSVYIAPGDAGKKISVPVDVFKNEGVASVGFLISYDSRLTAESSDIKMSTYVDGSISKIAFDDIKAVSIAIARTENMNVSAKICDISFTVPADAQPGDRYNIEIKKVYCWDHLIESNEAGYESGFTKMRELPISVRSGSIIVEGNKQTAADKNSETNKDYNKDHVDNANIVTPNTKDDTKTYLLGDANLDNTVDTKDAIVVLQYSAESIAGNNHKRTLETNADVNFDGEYDSKDAIFILQFYAEKVAGNIKENAKMDPFMADRGYEKK